MADTETKKKISFDIPIKLLEDLETLRKELGLARANFINIAIMEKVAKEKNKM